MVKTVWRWATVLGGVVILTTVWLGLSPLVAGAALAVYESGIASDQEYREVVFITGEPLLLSGELKVSLGREKNNAVTNTYYYKLSNAAGDVKLTRRLTLTTTRETTRQQTVEVTRLDKITETITVTRGKVKDTYVLKDNAYQFHKSVVTDHQAAVDYFSGNWNGRKVYTINKDEGEAVVELTGSTVGYSHYWGSTETQLVDYYLETDRLSATSGGARNRWTGTAQVKLALNRTKDLTYVPNEPTPISFRGGYLQTEQEENVLQYTYDLPCFSDGAVMSGRRNQGEDSFKLLSVPTQKRLPVATIRDIGGHWAEDDIARLASLGVFQDTTYFGPTLPMPRAEFARALALLTNMVPAPGPAVKQITLAASKPTSSASPAPAAAVPFVDVPPGHPYYQYIVEVEKRGVMQGASNCFFPDGALTRAEAVTTLIRALGFAGLAPATGYRTTYLDDTEIPIWAVDAIYLATEFGLIQGDRGYVYPNERMTRAEAAAFLNRFITFLQRDLKEHYRERVIYQH
ncbi:MAG: S-layer homology domain-containing protein [Firmicutes bacterium]|nr:S-layer homology domain-containing protein [Bacillota bacterium]